MISLLLIGKAATMTVKINMASGLKKARKAAGKSVEEVGAIINKSGKTIAA